MLRKIDKAYYSHRFAEEMQLAEHAPEAKVAAVQYELACRYGILAFDTESSTAAPGLLFVVDAGEQIAA